MTYSLENWKNDITKSLTFIVDRNLDVLDISVCDRDFVESLDCQFHNHKRCAFIVGIDGSFYNVDAFLTVSDAKNIIENLENVNYVYNYDRGVDSIIGNVRNFVKKYKSNEYWYIKFVLSQNSMFSTEDLVVYFENMNRGDLHEITNK